MPYGQLTYYLDNNFYCHLCPGGQLTLIRHLVSIVIYALMGKIWLS